MTTLLSLSRAARLVGQSRGKLQKQVQNGELTSFEGKVSMTELTQLYPQAHVEDNTMLEKVEEIIERARFKARNRIPSSLDQETLTARVSLLSDELAIARQEVGDYAIFIDKLKSRLKRLIEESQDNTKSILQQLNEWVSEQQFNTEKLPLSQRQLMAKDTILRIMAAQVHINPSGHEFLVEGSNSLLESGLSAGFALNYGCSNGNCGKCKARLVSGQIKKIMAHDYVLSNAEKSQQMFLMCSHTALTDLVIETAEAGTSRDIPVQTITARVKKVESLSDSISILNLKTPRTERLRFLAGQSVRLSLENGKQCVLPIASCPCDDMNIQFHIDQTHSEAEQELATNMKNGDRVELYGPEGDFILHEDPPHPVIFLAEGTAFAPIKSLIEHSVTLDVAESLHLYWLTSGEHYLGNLCHAWEDAFENFNYAAIKLNPSNDLASQLQEQLNSIKKNHSSLQHHHIYIAGTKEFVQHSQQFFQQQSVAENCLFTFTME
ncbi:MAG: 2Fe-2S iron-sulfur cluster-binding protein [Gammaproteobacteria bacterium]|nr:2Fe-2S iron-sulfur cluster-binding protein [Gammaproteobacteria bacterium]MDH5777168.1 2Fe-2S iron-sulfur cluster-binding protein [Gammaproteobacteria bacterium]